MRMYWAKKILEWTTTPADAFTIALALNNRWGLDGCDPNSVAGVAWAVGGKHDHGWSERPVFGKIRYMNEAGLRRKFRMDAYVARIDAVRRRVGLPPELAAAGGGGKGGRAGGGQRTLGQMSKEKKATASGSAKDGAQPAARKKRKV